MSIYPPVCSPCPLIRVQKKLGPKNSLYIVSNFINSQNKQADFIWLARQCKRGFKVEFEVFFSEFGNFCVWNDSALENFLVFLTDIITWIAFFIAKTGGNVALCWIWHQIKKRAFVWSLYVQTVMHLLNVYILISCWISWQHLFKYRDFLWCKLNHDNLSIH